MSQGSVLELLHLNIFINELSNVLEYLKLPSFINFYKLLHDLRKFWTLYLIPNKKNYIFSSWYNNVYYILNSYLHIKIATYLDMCRPFAGDMYFKKQACRIFTLNFVYCIFCLLFYKYI